MESSVDVRQFLVEATTLPEIPLHAYMLDYMYVMMQMKR